MLLNSAIQDAIVASLAVNASYYGNETTGVSNVARVPIAAAFTPSRVTTLADLVFPPDGFFDVNFIRADAIEASVIVNANGDAGLRLAEPTGGLTFIVDDDSLGPVTIFGNATVLLDGGGDPVSLISVGLLPTPQLFTVTGQIYQMSSVEGFINPTIFDAAAGAVPLT